MSFTTSIIGRNSTRLQLPESAKGIRLKLDRADKHIGELRDLLASFYAVQPYKCRVKQDRRTQEQIYYVSKVGRVPEELAIIAGDALHNLRSALDHLALRLYLITHPGKTEDIVYFPIANSATKHKSTGYRGRVECFGRNIAKRIDEIKPYKGGNDLLWRLHELNKIDKHRLVISAVSAVKSRSLVGIDYRQMLYTDRKKLHSPAAMVGWTTDGLPMSGPLKPGDILYRGPIIPDEQKQQLKFRVEVAFDEPSLGENQPLLASLFLFSTEVFSVCQSFSDLLSSHRL